MTAWSELNDSALSRRHSNATGLITIRGGFTDATWQAFWQTAVEGQSPQEAARDLGLTQAAVYLARSRIMARLKELIQQVQGD